MFLSPYIIAAGLAWVFSQGAKYVIDAIKQGGVGNVRKLYLSGHMPSAHSATVVAVTTTIGLINGFGSGLFGLAFIFSMVVMYDAVMVRRSSGEQGEALSQLIKEQKSKTLVPRIAKGHTPVEVAVGALIGVAIGCVVFLATK